MHYGRKDLKITLDADDVPSFKRVNKVYTSRYDALEELEGAAHTFFLETVKGIVSSGPFAGPFIVDIIRCTGSFRTQYFWNGRSMLRKELYLCGTHISLRRFDKILDALKLGAQIDNSTVPMIEEDLLKPNSFSMSDRFSA